MSKKMFIMLVLFAFMTFVSFNGCSKDDQTKSLHSAEGNSSVGNIDIQQLLSGTVKVVSVDDNTEQCEGEQYGETDNLITKKVTVSMVDISKVYQYFSTNGKAAEADATAIEQFIDENKDNPEFQTEYVIDAEVVEENGTWKLSTEESLKEIYSKQAETLILEKINEIGEIEIPDVSIEQEGGDSE